jgi:hypothetical protein
VYDTLMAFRDGDADTTMAALGRSVRSLRADGMRDNEIETLYRMLLASVADQLRHGKGKNEDKGRDKGEEK